MEKPHSNVNPSAKDASTSLWTAIYIALMESDPASKCHLAQTIYHEWQEGMLNVAGDELPERVESPGRPTLPLLVSPQAVPRRGLGTIKGRAILIHALAHIEFNAINLALDAAYRFRRMPSAFYGDWLKVAAEEAMHFGLLRDYLHDLGFTYGDFTAHNGLWEMAAKTAHDALARMALVPRLLEARGLDVTPGMQKKLQEVGDARAVEILAVILRDEIDHVAIGNHWFHYLCQQRGLDALTVFPALLAEFAITNPKPPFNQSARQSAGFTAAEMDWLNGGFKSSTQYLE